MKKVLFLLFIVIFILILFYILTVNRVDTHYFIVRGWKALSYSFYKNNRQISPSGLVMVGCRFKKDHTFNLYYRFSWESEMDKEKEKEVDWGKLYTLYSNVKYRIVYQTRKNLLLEVVDKKYNIKYLKVHFLGSIYLKVEIEYLKHDPSQITIKAPLQFATPEQRYFVWKEFFRSRLHGAWVHKQKNERKFRSDGFK